jgi:hypothetical protein
LAIVPGGAVTSIARNMVSWNSAKTSRVLVNWGTIGRLFDDCGSVMPRIGVQRALIRCDKPARMCTDLS